MPRSSVQPQVSSAGSMPSEIKKAQTLEVRKSPISARREKGVEERFWLAWNEHREYLKRLSMLWMNISAMEVEDALSDATIRALEKYKIHEKNINNQRAWFARLLHNICIDRHRSNRRRVQLGDKLKEIREISEAVITLDAGTPEGHLLNQELGRILRSKIEQLPEKLKGPLIMRLVQEETYDEIARRLDISNDNARKRVQQARAILRRDLAFLQQK
ncbi:RNA polymerase sigma factor [Sneathiella limimaris]|uniref:RNA polymerase sigma factor n=1 Tax=Sneathiella limimaris TaxID=1964213 RepID=UPI00146A6E90|nr:RNA polymerase sigma factor [Sneathiella limimaris]